jgi:hypothetical protein
MHATIRRYEGVDQNRTVELSKKVSESLVPKLEKLPGFAGYYLIEADDGVFSSMELFENVEQVTRRPGSQPVGCQNSVHTAGSSRFAGGTEC